MKVIESEKKHFCDNCDDYGRTWDIYTSEDSAGPRKEWHPRMALCKKCLMELFKAILER